MRIIRGHKQLGARLDPVVMTIGTYDGLHLGHRAIIERVVAQARREGRASLVYSFYPPPWRLLGKAEHPHLILTFPDKVALLEALGVDVLVTEEFTPELRAMSHEAFADDVLHGALDARVIHVGYDFRFGAGRVGDWRFLREHLGPRGVDVRPHGAVRVDGAVVGCTAVRAAVVEGRVADAAAMLGRHHVVRGVVVRGDARGRTIGFPTANVRPETELLPRAGVYGVLLAVVGEDGPPRRGIANVGVRPTFGGDAAPSVEVHLFDADVDLYGATVLVHFATRVRDERRFPSVEALVAQIRADVELVRSQDPFPAPASGAITWDPKPA